MGTGRNDVRFFDAGKSGAGARVGRFFLFVSHIAVIRTDRYDFTGVTGSTDGMRSRPLITGCGNDDDAGIPQLVYLAYERTVVRIGTLVIGAD